MTDADWLDIDPPAPLLPAPSLPAVISIPSTFAERVALVEECWSRLTLAQRQFLTMARECRFNQRRALRELGDAAPAKNTVSRWMHNTDYLTVFRLWQAIAGEGALDKDRLLLRQDDIVETLLTPKPILYQGAPTGFEEVDGSAAARANETLMKAAGMLKDKDVEINVGIIGPSLNIQVVMPSGDVRDVTGSGVPVALPKPVDAEWTEISDGA